MACSGCGISPTTLPRSLLIPAIKFRDPFGSSPIYLAICKKWDVSATVIGEVTDGDRLRITWKNELIVEVPPRTVAHEGPVYNP